MNKPLIAIVAAAAFMTACCNCSEGNLQYVDPNVGGVGHILQPTRPTVQIPNSMLRTYPWKNDQIDDQIHHFILQVTSYRVAWAWRFLPLSGEGCTHLSSHFTVENETCTPYFYSATQERTYNEVAVTPKTHSAIYRIDFKSDEGPYAFNFAINGRRGEVHADADGVVTGWDESQGLKCYIYAVTDAPVAEVLPKNEKKVSLMIADKGTYHMKYGVSYISVEQAKENLEKEIPGWDFCSVKAEAKKIWKEAMDRIQVEGGTLAQKRTFYSAFYHASERMVDINEYGRYWSSFDHQVHESAEPFYVDNWLWDMFITLQPLNMIIEPEKSQAMIRSYIEMYRQCGWVPNFAVAFGDWPAMTGNNAANWFTDAWFKGLRDFDLETAYEGVKKGSLEATMLPWNNGPATSLDKFYGEHGYMPGLRPGEAETEPKVDTHWEKRQCVSVTIDNSYSDWCISQLAGVLGKEEDVELFKNRSAFYRNVFNVEKGHVWPRDKEGNWIETADPKLSGREYFTENNGYNFDWSAKHDLYALFDLMGGPAAAEAKLDNLFRETPGISKFKFWGDYQPDSSGLVGMFVMGNQPTFHIPYIYNYLGSPWKAQKRVRMLLDTWFPDNKFGYPGDEDGGSMSAFVMFSMMGFYQVQQGNPIYCIGSPVFEKTTINLADGKTFTVKAPGANAENKYVQSARLNGKTLDRSWFTHEELVGGGVLELEMGPVPNFDWGKDNLPPSAISYNVE
ncbi:MAG: glycoside hydrolase family 92 protein [Bacteroidales bacterium]|nr:glycoside hydrolase family 92 protein [Bacteroidales bacterium]